MLVNLSFKAPLRTGDKTRSPRFLVGEQRFQSLGPTHKVSISNYVPSRYYVFCAFTSKSAKSFAPQQCLRALGSIFIHSPLVNNLLLRCLSHVQLLHNCKFSHLCGALQSDDFIFVLHRLFHYTTSFPLLLPIAPASICTLWMANKKYSDMTPSSSAHIQTFHHLVELLLCASRIGVCFSTSASASENTYRSGSYNNDVG